MCKSNENTQTGGGKFSEISAKVESLVNEISGIKGSAIIMIAIDDPENESGKQSTVGMVGKRGALIDLVAHSTAHPGAKDILDVLTDGLMLGIILKKGPKDK